MLGLESATATLRDVKKAYAKLLKQHRPDADPEGFQRVHEAYTVVLHELDLRDNPEAAAKRAPVPMPVPVDVPFSLSDLPPAAPEKPAPPAVDLPAPFVEAVEKLRTAPGAAAAPEALTQLRQACGEDAALWREWGKALAGIFDTIPPASVLAAVIPPSDVLSALRAGSGDAAVRILDVWHRERMLPNMVAVGQALTAKGAFREYDHPPSGFFALRLAFNLAISQPGGANLLIDAAFGWLPPAARSHAMPPVENRLNIGRIFWHVPSVWQGFWENTLDELDAGRTPDWTSPEARRAINDLLRVTPADWPGWGFLKSQLKELQWQGIVEHFNSRPVSRRSWTAPPERTWINPATTSISASAPFQARHPESKKKDEDDAWSIPDTDSIPVRPKKAPASASGPGLTGKAAAVLEEVAPHRNRKAPVLQKGAEKTGSRLGHYYYRMPRSVRILLLCILTWIVVFGIAWLIRIAGKSM